jgi:GT2 family glycosyltransferase
MVNWLCSGLIKSFPNKEVDVYFLLDNPIDGTDQLFEDGTVSELLKGFNVKWTVHYANPLEQFKFHLQNIGLKYGYDNGYDWIICPQDDQKIEDPFLIHILSMMISEVGLIGGRDGFNSLDFKNATGSLFSHPTGDGYKYLKNGETKWVKYLNDGPLIYGRNVIEKVGYHDERFKVFMSELDYCRRCEDAGFRNVNLGMSIVHEKFGTLRSNVYYQRHNYSAQDQKLFNEKWPT